MNEGRTTSVAPESGGRQSRHRRNTSAITIELTRDESLPAPPPSIPGSPSLPVGFSLNRTDTIASLYAPQSPMYDTSANVSTNSLVPILRQTPSQMDVAVPPTSDEQKIFTNDVSRAFAFIMLELSKDALAQGAALGASVPLSQWVNKLLNEGIEAAIKDHEWQKGVGSYGYGAVITACAAYTLFNWSRRATKPVIAVSGQHNIPPEKINNISLNIATALFAVTVAGFSAYGGVRTEHASALYAFATQVSVGAGVREIVTDLLKDVGIKSVPVILDTEGHQKIESVEKTAKSEIAVNVNYAAISGLINGLGLALAVNAMFNHGELQNNPAKVLSQVGLIAGVLSAITEGIDKVQTHFSQTGFNFFRDKVFPEGANRGYTRFELPKGVNIDYTAVLTKGINRAAVNTMVLLAGALMTTEHAIGAIPLIILSGAVAQPLSRFIRTYANFTMDQYEKRYPERPTLTRPRLDDGLDEIEMGVLSAETARAQRAHSASPAQQSSSHASEAALTSVTAGVSALQVGAPAHEQSRNSAFSIYDGVLREYFDPQQQHQDQGQTHNVQVELNMMPSGYWNQLSAVKAQLDAKKAQQAAVAKQQSKDSSKTFPAATCCITQKDLNNPTFSEDSNKTRERALYFFNDGHPKSDSEIVAHYARNDIKVINFDGNNMEHRGVVTADSVERTVFCEPRTLEGQEKQVFRIKQSDRPDKVGVTVGQVIPVSFINKVQAQQGTIKPPEDIKLHTTPKPHKR